MFLEKLQSTGSNPRTIAIPSADMQVMQQAVEAAVPEEACGLLAGEISGSHADVRRTIPVTNILHSPVRFRMSGEEQVAAFNLMEGENLELVGIYHSHPGGPAGPSATDVLEAYYPEAIHIIWSRNDGSWECAGFYISQGEVLPAAIIT